jgi:hypothetical protein
MENIRRENIDFWNNFIYELTSEINESLLLLPFIDKLSKTKKREEGHSKAQSYSDFLVKEVFPKSLVLKKYGFICVEPETDREHGDFYLYNEKYNCVITCNAKFGVSKKLGQPNMCSIERAADYLHNNNLPYLVFKLRKVKDNFKFHAFDLFNFVDVIRYNDGTGQLMVSESKFYNKKEFKYLKTSEAMVYICNIQEIAYMNLIKSREIRFNKFQELKKTYE